MWSLETAVNSVFQSCIAYIPSYRIYCNSTTVYFIFRRAANQHLICAEFKRLRHSTFPTTGNNNYTSDNTAYCICKNLCKIQEKQLHPYFTLLAELPYRGENHHPQGIPEYQTIDREDDCKPSRSRYGGIRVTQPRGEGAEESYC